MLIRLQVLQFYTKFWYEAHDLYAVLFNSLIKSSTFVSNRIIVVAYRDSTSIVFSRDEYKT